MRGTWEALKAGATLYLSIRERHRLYDYIQGLIDGQQRDYYGKHFKFTVDPDDRERATYECYCTTTFEAFRAKNGTIYELGSSEPKMITGLKPYTPPEPKSQVDVKLEQALAMIQSIEEIMGVSVLARGGAYGSSKLVVRDNKTEKELVRS